MNIEKTIICHLMACGVPEDAIKVVRAEKSNIITVTVQAPHGTEVRDYSAFQLINGKPYIVDEMVSIAYWYHGINTPKSQTTFVDWIRSSEPSARVAFAVINCCLIMIAVAVIHWLVR